MDDLKQLTANNFIEALINDDLQNGRYDGGCIHASHQNPTVTCILAMPKQSASILARRKSMVD